MTDKKLHQVELSDDSRIDLEKQQENPFELKKRPPETREMLAKAIHPEGAITEERIREIIREELTKWEKQQLQRARFGLPLNMETK